MYLVYGNLYNSSLSLSPFPLDCREYSQTALMHISSCVVTLLQSRLINISFESVLLDFCVYQVSHNSEAVRKAYLDTLCYFPGSSILRYVDYSNLFPCGGCFAGIKVVDDIVISGELFPLVDAQVDRLVFYN